MRNEALSLYVKRKSGKGQSIRWKIRTALSTLLLLAVTALLSFAVVFIFSMADGLDNVLQLLGSGTLVSYDEIEPSLLPPQSYVNEVKTTQALCYSLDESALVTVKGVDDDYFFSERRDALNLDLIDNPTTLDGIIISRILASELSVEAGDNLALMIYDADMERIRPVYLFIEGTYSTGYSEFDSSLVFTSGDLAGGTRQWEIYTASDASSFENDLVSRGYNVVGYQRIYASIYSNIKTSVTLLSAVVTLLAFLAGFFSISVSAEYIERDKRDIALMMLSGSSSRDMAGCYMMITVRRVLYALLSGLALGIAAALLFIPFLSGVNVQDYPFLQSYVTDFPVRIPYVMLLAVFIVLLLSSCLSLFISLRKGTGASLKGALVS